LLEAGAWSRILAVSSKEAWRCHERFVKCKSFDMSAALPTLLSRKSLMLYAYQFGKSILALFRALLQVDPIYPIQH
jgi:hypothetical protein